MSAVVLHPAVGVRVAISDWAIVHEWGQVDGAYRLARPLSVITTYRGSVGYYAEHVRLRKGMVSDGASVPRWFWWFMGPYEGKVILAALLHDGGYAAQAKPRVVVDAQLRADLVRDGVSQWRAWVAWAAVRLFGWKPWRDKRRALETTA